MSAAASQVLDILLKRDDDGSAPPCQGGNDYDGKMGARISSVFVILVTSMFGALFPVLANRFKGLGIPSWAFFIAKYFGSGVILATAFIHLLAPAVESLTDECLTGPITEYDWAEGIALMTIGVLFFVELMTMRYAKFGQSHMHGPDDGEDNQQPPVAPPTEDGKNTHIPGEDHLGHARDHQDLEHAKKTSDAEDYAAQLTAVFVLEFGIVFHSVFVGLSLAVAGSEFATLYVVLVFHQMFEGLGLGSRLATIPWPKSKRFTPYILGFLYGITTPIAIAIGLGVRTTYPPGSRTSLLTNGVFDSISAGILIYTALVELMAHEFMFSSSMRKAPIQVVLSAFGLLCLGALLMALLGKWA